MKHFEEDASERFFKIRLKPGPRPDGKALLCLRSWDDPGSPALQPVVTVRVKVKVGPDAASLRLLRSWGALSHWRPRSRGGHRGGSGTLRNPGPLALHAACPPFATPWEVLSLALTAGLQGCPGDRGHHLSRRAHPSRPVRPAGPRVTCAAGMGCVALLPGTGCPSTPPPNQEGPLGPPHLCLWGCLTWGSHPQAQEAPSGLSVECHRGASMAGAGDPDRPPADAR